MANYLSPGVYSSEIDLSTSVPSIATGITAYAGKFNKGEAFKRILVTNVDQLISKMGLPDNNNFNDWYQAERFLRNGSELYLVRAVNNDISVEATFEPWEAGRKYLVGEGVSIEDTLTAVITNVITKVVTTEKPVVTDGSIVNTEFWKDGSMYPSQRKSMNAGIELNSTGTGYFSNSYTPNFEQWELDYDTKTFEGSKQLQIVSRSIGPVGNKISISMTNDLTVGIEKPVTDTWKGDGRTTYLVGNYAIGDIVFYEKDFKLYKSLENSNEKIPGTTESVGWWEDISHEVNDVVHYNGINWYSVRSNNGDTPSETSEKWSKGTTFENVFEYELTEEELAIVIFSEDSIVESFIVSTKEDGVDEDGNNIFIDNIINGNSKYIYLNSKDSATFPSLVQQATLRGGTYTTPEKGDLQEAYNSFTNTADFDVSIIIANEEINDTCIDIAKQRQDCITIAGAPKNLLVGNSDPVTSLIDYVKDDINTENSYSAFYGNYIQIFDQYNSKYRWINIAGAVAGSQVRTNSDRDAWWANAGMERGHLGDVIKIAYNPNETERGILYRNKINPIVSFPGQGNCIIWGQKTLLSRKSAFDRLNVRQLFLVVEKAINKALKYFVFEINDVFTRAQIIAMITPFLEDIKGRRGIYEYKIVADETINTSEVIDANTLKVNVLIKPTRVAEFIEVKYIATRTGANLSEIAKAIA